jgi:hypothetical protein
VGPKSEFRLVAKTSKVKHERDRHFADANLENVLRAAAGLLVFLDLLAPG